MRKEGLTKPSEINKLQRDQYRQMDVDLRNILASNNDLNEAWNALQRRNSLIDKK